MASSPIRPPQRPVETAPLSGTATAPAAPAAPTAPANTLADGFAPAQAPRNTLALRPPAGEALRGGIDLGGIIRGGLKALLGKDSTGQLGWMQQDKSLPPTKDITSDFKSTYEAVKIGGNPLPDEAKDFVYLTVDGLTGENWPGYMEGNREALRDKGLDVREIKVDTEASTLTNVETIKKAIEQAASEGKQVVLIGHSKGGVDTSATLAMHPELKQHVRAFVAMQAPYGGAPLATDLLSNGATKLGVAALAKLVFNGDPKTVRDLTYAYRQEFVEKYPFPTDIPTVSLATTDTSQLSLVAGPSNYVRLRYGEKTDGLVHDKDGMIPGSNVVRLDNLDHIDSVMPNLKQLSAWDPGDLTVSLVAMALKHPPATQA